MADMKPYEVNSAELQEIMTVQLVRESWGLDEDTSPQDFASMVYAAKFHFVSGSPGHVGDIFILQGDVLTGDPPVVLYRAANGKLRPA